MDASMVGPLMSGLAAASVPNPKTPAQRPPPNGSLMLDAKRIARAVEMAFETGRDPLDPVTGHVLHAMGKTADGLSKGMDGQSALTLLQSLVGAAPPTPATGAPGLPPVQPGPAQAPPSGGAGLAGSPSGLPVGAS